MTIAGAGVPRESRSYSRLRQSRLGRHAFAAEEDRELVERGRTKPRRTRSHPVGAVWPTPSGRSRRARASPQAGQPGVYQKQAARAACRLAELERPAPSGTSPAIAA